MSKYLNVLLSLALLLAMFNSSALSQPNPSQKLDAQQTAFHDLLGSAGEDIEAKNFDAATQKLAEARSSAKMPEDQVYVVYMTSLLSLAQNKPEETRAILDARLKDASTPSYQKPLLYTVYGDSYVKQGKYALARQAYSQILDDRNILDPKFRWYNRISAWYDKLEATSKIATAFAKEGNAEVARKTLQDFKATTSSIVKLFSIDLELAKLEANFIDEDAGVLKYQQLLNYIVASVEPTDVQSVENYKNLVRLDLAELYIKRKDVEKARSLYEQVLKDPDFKELAQKELKKLAP